MDCIADTAEIRKEMKAIMPAAAFEPDHSQLLEMFSHLFIFLFCVALLPSIDSVMAVIILALIAGHSIFCVGNVAHYLAHGSVVRNQFWRYVFEYLFFGVTLTSATVFRVVHIKYHHAYTNGEKDTFRCFADNERRGVRTLVRLLFFPNRHLPWNPLIGLSYTLALTTQTVCALIFRSGHSSSVIPNVPRYTTFQRIKVYAETLGIAGFVYSLTLYVGEWPKVVLFLGLTYSLASTVTSYYIYTQHDTLDLSNINNPLDNSMNISPHPVIDWIHSNFSYHIEHHLFPTMNYRYMPLLSAELRRHYSDHYKSASGLAIWKKLFRNSVYKPALQSGAKQELPVHE